MALKKNFRAKYLNDVIFNCVMRGAEKMADSRFSSSGSGSTSTTSTDAQGTSSDCELRSMSLLERLRASSPSELGRKRKIDANPPPPKGKKRLTQNVRKFDPISVQPSQRVNEFPGEELSESSGKLCCKACREIALVIHCLTL